MSDSKRRVTAGSPSRPGAEHYARVDFTIRANRCMKTSVAAGTSRCSFLQDCDSVEWGRVMSGAEAQEYAAFISYSRKDLSWARWLQKKLENYKVDRNLVGTVGEHSARPANFRPVFRDITDLPAGGELTSRLEDALTRSRFLIVVCSPDSVRSKWVGKEIGFFQKVHGSIRIIPIIVGSDPADVSDTSWLVPALRSQMGPDGAIIGQECRKLGADARKTRDGKRVAFLKVVSGMLDVDLDIVTKRYQERLRQQIRNWTAGLSCALAIAGFLGWKTFENYENFKKETEFLKAFASNSNRTYDDVLMENVKEDAARAQSDINDVIIRNGVGFRIRVETYLALSQDYNKLFSADEALASARRAGELLSSVAAENITTTKWNGTDDAGTSGNFSQRTLALIGWSPQIIIDDSSYYELFAKSKIAEGNALLSGNHKAGAVKVFNDASEFLAEDLDEHIATQPVFVQFARLSVALAGTDEEAGNSGEALMRLEKVRHRSTNAAKNADEFDYQAKESLAYVDARAADLLWSVDKTGNINKIRQLICEAHDLVHNKDREHGVSAARRREELSLLLMSVLSAALLSNGENQEGVQWAKEVYDSEVKAEDAYEDDNNFEYELSRHTAALANAYSKLSTSDGYEKALQYAKEAKVRLTK